MHLVDDARAGQIHSAREVPLLGLAVCTLAICVGLNAHLDYMIFKYFEFAAYYPSRHSHQLYQAYLGTITALPLLIWLLTCVCNRRNLERKLEEVFTCAGLKNRLGKVPRLIFKANMGNEMTRLRLTNANFPVERFEELKGYIEGGLGVYIDFIKENRAKNTVDIIYGKRPMQDLVSYEPQWTGDTPPNAILIGLNRSREVVCDLSETPHLLVAGQTSSGKSTFLRQAITTLYSNNEAAEFTLIDLNGSLEFQLFRGLPRVSVISDTSMAVIKLKTLENALKRLWQLEKGGFIRSVSVADDGRRWAWGIDKKGFHAIRDSLPALKSEGYKSEHRAHDFQVTAFHLSDFLMDAPNETKLVSEQQLRRYECEFYPQALPRSELHRPDGYTIVRRGDRKIITAIEVELTPKRRADYEPICEYYRYEKIDAVLWLVPRTSLAKRLHRIFSDYERGEISRHNFVCYDDFCRDGLSSGIVGGKHESTSVRTIIGNTAETFPQDVSHEFLFDTRKAPHRSKTYRPFATQEILD